MTRMLRPWLVALSLLAGCDAVFGLGEPDNRDAGGIDPGDDGAPADGADIEDGGAPTPDAPAPIVCATNDFAADLTGWATATSGACTQALCVLAISNGAAAVKLGATGGLNSTLNPSVDFRDGTVAIETIPGTTASSTSQLRVAMSNSETLGIGLVMDSVRNPTLVVTRTSGGLTSTTMPTPYNATAHRHWQIAHVTGTASGAELVVSTRATGAPGWTELTRVPAPADVSTTFAQLDVRRTTVTNDSDPAGSVVSFDNFSLCGR